MFTQRRRVCAAAYQGRVACFDVVRGTPLPAGWYGKPWACEQGFRAAREELLLFTDADTRHAPGLLGRAVAALRREQADLVTVAPRQLCLGFWGLRVQS